MNIIPSDGRCIFLSYARTDATWAEQVESALSGGGLRVWMDRSLSKSSYSWTRETEEALGNSAAMVVVLSPQAKESDWVDREVIYALDRRLPVYSVMAHGNRQNAVPLALASAQVIGRVTDPEALASLTRDLVDRFTPGPTSADPADAATDGQSVAATRSAPPERSRPLGSPGNPARGAVAGDQQHLASSAAAPRVTAHADRATANEASPLPPWARRGRAFRRLMAALLVGVMTLGASLTGLTLRAIHKPRSPHDVSVEVVVRTGDEDGIANDLAAAIEEHGYWYVSITVAEVDVPERTVFYADDYRDEAAALAKIVGADAIRARADSWDLDGISSHAHLVVVVGRESPGS